MNQFDVYLVDLDPAKGSEMKKTRPVVIISPNALNRHLNTVIIAPLTHTLKGYLFRVPSLFNSEPGEVALDQMKYIDKSKLKKKLGRIDASTAANIKAVLGAMFS